MAESEELSIDQRLFALFKHLGIEKAHIAANAPNDWLDIVVNRPEVLATLSLVCPTRADVPQLAALGSHLLVVNGDGGPIAGRIDEALLQLPEAKTVTLTGYPAVIWSNVATDKTTEIEDAMNGVMGPTTLPQCSATGTGEVAGITYEIFGSGPPLVLFPLGLAPSQWNALIPALQTRFAVIQLGGRHVGYVSILEARGQAPAYRKMVHALFDGAQIGRGQAALEVGSGSGAVSRLLADRVGPSGQAIGADVNRFLIKEAASLAASTGVTNLAFEEGDAQSLPFESNRFDSTVSVTVMEETDADGMLAEMVRVTKPGGRIAVIVRATDIPWVVNISDAELKASAEAPGGVVSPSGCGDASLYRRFEEAGLEHLEFFPYHSAFTYPSKTLATWLAAVLAQRPTMAGRGHLIGPALAEAQRDGRFMVSFPHHCAIGTKPL